MHLGHQQLFLRQNKDGAIVVIQTDYENLSPNRFRSRYTKFPIIYYPLKNIKHLSGKEFIDLLTQEFPNLEKIIVGFDFHFGYKASYGIDDLKKMFQGEVVIVDEYKIDNIAVHSRVIREYLRSSKIEEANRLLGYNYTIEGEIIQGQGLGKKQFVPTINLNIKLFLIPQEGIYITQTKLNNKLYNSVTFIGHRVTTDGKFAVETHLLNQDIILKDEKNIQITFFHKIRDNKKFDIYEDLKDQILDDISKAKQYFKDTNG